MGVASLFLADGSPENDNRSGRLIDWFEGVSAPLMHVGDLAGAMTVLSIIDEGAQFIKYVVI